MLSSQQLQLICHYTRVTSIKIMHIEILVKQTTFKRREICNWYTHSSNIQQIQVWTWHKIFSVQCSVPLLAFLKLSKHWIYVLKGSVCLFSHLHNTRQEANHFKLIHLKNSDFDMKSIPSNKIKSYLSSCQNYLSWDEYKQHNLWLFHSIDQPRK